MRSKITLFLILSTSFFLLTSPSFGEVSDSSEVFTSDIDTNLWDVRNEIIINNPSSLLNNFQVLIVLPEVFDYSYFQPNGSDIRFVDSNNDSLSHWVEDWNVSGTSRLWVNCTSLSSGSNSIFMYYNNSAASSVSNGTNVFDFFDDFEGQDLGAFPNDWIISPNPNINLSVSATSKIGDRGLFVDQSPDPTGLGLRNFNVDAVGKILEYWAKPTKSSDSSIPYYTDSSITNNTGGNTYWGSRTTNQLHYYDTSYHYIGNYVENNWYLASIHFNSSSQYSQHFYYENLDLLGEAKNINYRFSPNKIDRFVFTTYAGKTLQIYIDNLKIRKYAAQEPTVTIEPTEFLNLPEPTPTPTTPTGIFGLTFISAAILVSSVLIVTVIVSKRKRD